MAFNSTIKPKTGTCLDCAYKGNLTAGRCPYHYKKHRSELSSKKTKTDKVKKPFATKKKLEPKDAELNKWFYDIESVIARRPNCWECKTYIPINYYRHATAHIFPKSIFESVATNECNYLVCAAGCGCHDKTHTIESFKKMSVWPTAVKRFLKFYKEIKERHKYLWLFIDAALPYMNEQEQEEVINHFK